MNCLNCGHGANQHLATGGGGVMCQQCGCTTFVPDTEKKPPKK